MKLASMVAGLAMFAGVAQAQTVTAAIVEPYSPGGTAIISPFGYYMSPYAGTIDNGAAIQFNCVDYFHEVMVGQQYSWQATTTNIGTLVDASNSNNMALLNSLLGNTREGTNYPATVAVKLYEEASLLTTMYAPNPGSDPTGSSAIQTAIWAIMTDGLNPSFPTNQYIGSGSANEGDTGFWINYAQDNYSKQSTDFYDQFNVLTGVDHSAAGAQEFIYATPEPASLMLMATGLLGVAGFAAKRRRKGAVEAASV